MGDKDKSYKLLFSHAQMVEELLRDFVREDWVKLIDFSTLKKYNNSFVSDDLKERFDDVIWTVKWGKQQLYIYILIEFQSGIDYFMSVRMMTYLGLLYQDLIMSETVKTGQKLPPVLPIVLYNGAKRWKNAPLDIKDTIEKSPRGLDRYLPQLRYLLIDEGYYDRHELLAGGACNVIRNRKIMARPMDGQRHRKNPGPNSAENAEQRYQCRGNFRNHRPDS